MMPMSKNGVKVNNSSSTITASNGRSMAPANAVTSTSTSAATITTATTTTTQAAAAAAKAATAVKVNNNDGHAMLSGHRRDNSNVSATTQQHGVAKKDTRLYQYAKPQQHFNAAELATGDANSDCLLAYADGKLVSGTLEALITHMVPSADYYPDFNYVFAFLLSARLFIRPHELLARIAVTWELQQHQLQQQQQQQHHGTDTVDEANFSYLSMAAHGPSPLMARKLSLSYGGEHDNELVQQQQQQHQQQQPKGLRNTVQRSAQNCIRLLSEWIETFPYDFRDERLMQQVRILARKCVYIDNSLGKHVSRILQMLVQRLTALEKYEEFLQSLLAADLNGAHPYGTSASASYTASSSGGSTSSGAPLTAPATGGAAASLTGSGLAAASGHPNSLGNTAAAASATTAMPTACVDVVELNSHDVYGVMEICGNCAQMAHQLTAIELERLSHIGPEEFVQAFAKEYHNSIASKAAHSSAGAALATSTPTAVGVAAMHSSSLNDMKKTRNLESYVEWFNRLSYLTASEIVKYPKKKQRVRVIEFWIETARECFNIGNFNSLMAIIAGLNLAPISRLKKTWSKVQSAKFSVLEHQMDPTSNFNSYRSTLKAAMWRSEGATDERERIIIPFFSLFVKDLYFLNEGCSNRLPNNHINFEKCSQLAKQIMEFNEWKKVSCPYEKLPHVIAYLQHAPVLNESTLSMASFECETPENTEEKDRYKTVKAETKQLLQRLQEQQQKQQVLQQH